MTLLQHHTLALALTCATTFGLGLLVFLAEPKRRLNQIFGFYSLSIAWWSFMETLVINSGSVHSAKSVLYLEWPGVILIAPTFIHTVFLLVEDKGHFAKFILKTAYALSLLLLTLHLLFDLLTATPRPVAYTLFFANTTSLGLLTPLLFLILVNIGLWKLGRAYHNAVGQRRMQLKFLFWASVIGYWGGSPDWFLVFGFHVPWLNPFGIYCVPLYSIATTYAVLHHRLFDFNLAIRKSLVYSILVTFLTVGYFALVFGIERIFQNTLGYQSLWLSTAAFALMALAFQPLKIGIQRAVDWLLFRRRHEELVKRMERLEQEALKAEKLRTVATLAAGLCHELRNPLQAIQTHAEYLPEKCDDPEFRKSCSEIMKTETARINDLLRQLMDFAKPKLPALRAVEPHKILDSTLDILSNEFVRRGTELEKSYQADGVQIQADPDQLRQVILNLTLNALQAMDQGGCVTVKTYQENGWFAFEVKDTGPGIDPKIFGKLFEPFNSSKCEGNGLGLSVVHSIVREHRGKITAQSTPGRGALFTVKLPAQGS